MRWSGGAQQLLWMASALQKRGHQLILGCQPGSDILERARVAGLPTETVRMRQDYDVPASFDVAKALKRHHIELLHAQHSTAHAIGLMAVLWAKVRAFAVTRRVIFPIKTNVFSRLKYLSKRINGYVAISQAVRDELLKAGINDSRITVIPSITNAVALSRGEGMALRRELALAVARPLVTSVANYSDYKGQDVLIQAAAEVLKSFPDAQFLLVGHDTDKLQPLVDRLGIAKSVCLAGFRTDIPRVLAATDLFVMPSLQEAAGTALREAMFSGIACIGTNVGGIPESIQDGETGLLVPPADPGALASAISRLLADPPQAGRLAERGKAWIRDHFSLETAASQMETFYEKILSHSALPSR